MKPAKTLIVASVACLCSYLACGDGLVTLPLKLTKESLQIDLWQVDPVEYNGRIYVVGGHNGVSLDTVQFAEIGPDGSLGPWVATTPLPQPDQGPAVTVFKGHLYVAGASGNIWSAAINSDGTLEPWDVEASPATYNFTRMIMEEYCGRLYLLGGWTGTTQFAEVYYARINPNGSVGTWTQTASMPQGRQHQSVHFYNGRVYIVGGITNTLSILDSAASAPVNPDGSLGAWRTEPSLPHPLWLHHSLLVNGEIFLFGGRTGYSAGAVSTIYRGAINPVDGTISEWVQVGCLPTDYTECVGAVYASAAGGVAYLIGGRDEVTGAYTADVLRNARSGDVNRDGRVDVLDLIELLLQFGFGTGCPSFAG